jgi:hypothetical protein
MQIPVSLTQYVSSCCIFCLNFLMTIILDFTQSSRIRNRKHGTLLGPFSGKLYRMTNKVQWQSTEITLVGSCRTFLAEARLSSNATFRLILQVPL